MNMLKRNLLAALVAAAFAAPFAAFAEEAPAGPAVDAGSPPPAEAQAPAKASDPAERAALIRTMRARMHEMMQTQDVNTRKELMAAQMKDMDALMEMGPPAMGMGMMMGRGMGPGMGAGPMMGMGPMGMMGQEGRPACRMKHDGAGMGPGMMGMNGHCPRADAIDQRLDELEKRVDLMQSMMQHMMSK